jgi:hypothetical protein
MTAVAKTVILTCDVCGEPGETVTVSADSGKWFTDLCPKCLGELVSGWGLQPTPQRRKFHVYRTEKEAREALGGP